MIKIISSIMPFDIERTILVKELLRDLTDTELYVIYKRYFEGYTAIEIGRMNNWSVTKKDCSNVSQLTWRALKKMRRKLKLVKNIRNYYVNN